MSSCQAAFEITTSEECLDLKAHHDMKEFDLHYHYVLRKKLQVERLIRKRIYSILAAPLFSGNGISNSNAMYIAKKPAPFDPSINMQRSSALRRTRRTRSVAGKWATESSGETM